MFYDQSYFKRQTSQTYINNELRRKQVNSIAQFLFSKQPFNSTAKQWLGGYDYSFEYFLQATVYEKIQFWVSKWSYKITHFRMSDNGF